MVFYNKIYRTFENAQNKPNGLVVLARLFDLSHSSNAHFGFVPYLKYISRPKTSYSIQNPAFTLSNLFGPIKFNYFTYDGSLTTPPCYESVTWIVINNAMKIYSKDLKAMQKLFGFEGTIAPNYRPIQNTNGRVIEYFKS